MCKGSSLRRQAVEQSSSCGIWQRNKLGKPSADAMDAAGEREKMGVELVSEIDGVSQRLCRHRGRKREHRMELVGDEMVWKRRDAEARRVD